MDHDLHLGAGASIDIPALCSQVLVHVSFPTEEYSFMSVPVGEAAALSAIMLLQELAVVHEEALLAFPKSKEQLCFNQFLIVSLPPSHDPTDILTSLHDLVHRIEPLLQMMFI